MSTATLQKPLRVVSCVAGRCVYCDKDLSTVRAIDRARTLCVKCVRLRLADAVEVVAGQLRLDLVRFAEACNLAPTRANLEQMEVAVADALGRAFVGFAELDTEIIGAEAC